MDKTVKLTWLGHSCFRMDCGGWSVVVDPYADGSVPGLGPVRQEADAVFCSHSHGDHSFAEGVTLSGKSAPDWFSVEEAVCPHDDAGGTLRGMNTVRLFRFGDRSIAHMGDVGCMPDEAVLAMIRGCDVLLVPVGGHYTVDPAGAFAICEAAAPKAVVPMHYRGDGFGYDVIGTVDPFVRRFAVHTKLGGNSMIVTADTPRGLVLLSPAR